MDNKMYEVLNDENLSEKLMQSGTFKKEAREALKNEMPNVSDEQLATIIRCIQKGLKASSDADVEQELKKVSGGISKKQVLEIVADAVPLLSAAAGVALGGSGGMFTGYAIGEKLSAENEPNFRPTMAGGLSGVALGGVGGLGLGMAIRAGIKKLVKKC